MDCKSLLLAVKAQQQNVLHPIPSLMNPYGANNQFVINVHRSARVMIHYKFLAVERVISLHPLSRYRELTELEDIHIYRSFIRVEVCLLACAFSG